MVQDSLKTCSFDMSYCYKARVVPVISSVSESEGMINGGQELVIKGYGFSNGTVEVMIDGVQCVEKTKTDYEVTCLTGRANQISDQTEGVIYGGQNGLKSKNYHSGRVAHAPFSY